MTMFLASAMVLPTGLSYAQSYGGTMQPSSNPTGSMNQTLMMHDNATSTNGPMAMSDNVTMAKPTSAKNTTGTMIKTMNSTASQPNNTKAAQQVSDFIHTAVADFKKQGNDSLKVILDCRAKVQAAAPNDVDSIEKACSVQLAAINAKYQDERNHYHDLVKQYRSSVMVFLNDARGLSVSKETLDSAVAQLGMMMHPAMTNSTRMGYTATMNNTHCVNTLGGPAIC